MNSLTTLTLQNASGTTAGSNCSLRNVSAGPIVSCNTIRHESNAININQTLVESVPGLLLADALRFEYKEN